MSPCRTIKNVTFSMSLMLLASCGAPVKSAADVAGIFNATESLQDKMTALCQQLNTRTESPATNDLRFQPACVAAGDDATEYNRDPELFIDGRNGLTADADNGKPYVDARLRTQIWLNRSLVGLAAAIGRVLAENKDYKGGEITVARPKNGPDFSGLLPTRIEIVEAPKLDLKSLAFGLKIRLKVGDTDEILIDNEIEASGRILNDSILVTVKSLGEKPYEESLVRNFGALAVIIPHANDVYVDVDLNLAFNKGTGLENLIKALLPQLLGSALKPGLDYFLNL